MRDLSDFLMDFLNYPIDGLCHCIGGTSVKRTAPSMVCSLNDWPGQHKDSNYEMFEKFFKSGYVDGDYVLGMGANKTEMEKMITDDRFNGFGEFIVYKYYTLFGYLDTDKDLFLFTLDRTKKPIYVHYELNSDSKEWFEDVLASHPDNKVVLCHCGMEKFSTNADKTYDIFKDLIERYPNLWGDVSWHTLTYFVENTGKLLALPLDRVIIGTDASERDNEAVYAHRLQDFHKLRRLVHNEQNITKLFNN